MPALAPKVLASALSAMALFALPTSTTLAADAKRGGTVSVGVAQDPAVVDPIRTGTFTERQFALRSGERRLHLSLA